MLLMGCWWFWLDELWLLGAWWREGEAWGSGVAAALLARVRASSCSLSNGGQTYALLVSKHVSQVQPLL